MDATFPFPSSRISLFLFNVQLHSNTESYVIPVCASVVFYDCLIFIFRYIMF